MALDRMTIGAPPAQLRVEGLRTTLRALEAAGADMGDMPEVMHRLGLVVVDAARPRVRTKSGRMAGTLRAGRGKTKAVVRMGGARAPYAPVQEYGWPARNISPSRALVDAYTANRARILGQLSDELEAILQRRNLK